MEQLLTVPEAAKKLGFHEQTLYRYIKLGRLDIIRISGTRIRIEPESLARFVQGLKEQTAAVDLK